jgi:hypothetical protein
VAKKLEIIIVQQPRYILLRSREEIINAEDLVASL